jgi:nicotinate-nucleotide pyrophosphorylase (carboxylating)
MNFHDPLIERLIALSLDEDAPNGDVTAALLLTQPRTVTVEARLIVKQDGVICGLPLLSRIIDCYRARVKDVPPMQVVCHVAEGTWCSGRTEVATVTGPARDILTMERVFLNFLQRLSGVATLTRSYVAAAPGNTILDTRKTTPGLRLLEKYAVTIGGGCNHRMSLSDMILIKNNHIDGLQGDFTLLAQRVHARPDTRIPVEVEVRNLHEIEQCLQHLHPHRIMLDNFTDEAIFDAVKFIRERNQIVQIEVSGGMNRERIGRLSALVQGVFISVGALTTQAQNIDISLSV